MRIWFAFVLLIAGCTHAPPTVEGGVTPLSKSEYDSVIGKHTVKTDQYSGFYQTFQADMTILSTEVQTAALKQKAAFLQWDEKQYQIEREKILQEATSYSKFFMRFYSPERDYDDLHKGKTIWRVYLESGGTRYEGKVRKLEDKFVEIQTLYPHFDRFSTPYEISFQVPMATVEGAPCKVFLTSSLGTAEFNFPASK